MAAQAALIAETIAGMKRAVARYQDSSASESDEPYLQPTNRGNKLKRKAHFLQDGRMGRPGGTKAFKRTIEHAGHYRDILRRNPKRYDEDGDELDDEDVDEEADARAAEENPYAEIRLESLLAPLTSAATLPEHPSMSVPYISPTLTDMAQNACEMAQRERKTLSNAKKLLTKLRGDKTWIPCGMMYSEKDEAMFDTEKLYKNITSKRLVAGPNGAASQDTANGSFNSSLNGELSMPTRTGSNAEVEVNHVNETPNGLPQNPAAKASIEAEDIIPDDAKEPGSSSMPAPTKTWNGTTDQINDIGITGLEIKGDANGEAKPEDPDDANRKLEDELVDIIGSEVSITGQDPARENTLRQDTEAAQAPDFGDVNGHGQQAVETEKHPKHIPAIAKALLNHNTSPDREDPKEEDVGEAGEGDGESKPAPRRMRTRAQAQAASEPTASSRTESPESWVPPSIHPIFQMPDSALPDRDFGLALNEAEDTRRMLNLYVQKQEEVCRGAERLYEGLLLADRQRKTVFKWCKAEGHVGEMSDGEDWYDKEEWGLEEDLRKGHNDEEDDNVIQGKKTRGRRA